MYIAQETVVSHAPLPEDCLLPETATNIPGSRHKCNRKRKQTYWIVNLSGRLPYPECLAMNFGAEGLVINTSFTIPQTVYSLHRIG